MDTLAARIKALRTAQGLSLRRLARDAGISPAYVMDIETGRRHASLKVLERIALVLDVPVGELQALGPQGTARSHFDAGFREDAVRMVRETGRPVRQVAQSLGISDGVLGEWVRADKRHRESPELACLRLALADDWDGLMDCVAGLEDGYLERLGKAGSLLRDAASEVAGRRH